ncbi:hypothetical protein GI582_11775 [Sulfitobacter sp. BDSS02]|nr:hypothetical protein [Sulfitobacter sp. BDSS02]MBR9848590.1 DUF1664 domain-containing protein [Paracoccaceae bacterium]
MNFIADILLIAGALGAVLYCYVLSKKLSRFNNLDKGVGGAIAVLSAQVDELSNALISARSAADQSAKNLEDLTARAEAARTKLDLMMASMHDLPDTAEDISARKKSNGTSEGDRADIIFKRCSVPQHGDSL